jgi:ribosomal protein S18 acetylase RimI-like enzyme
MPIREFRITDFEQVKFIEHNTFNDPYSDNFIKDWLTSPYRCYVIEEDQKIMGFIVVQLNENALHVYNIAVNEADRKRGFGKSLMLHIKSINEQEFHKPITLSVEKINRAVVPFYEKLGYCNAGESDKHIHMKQSVQLQNTPEKLSKKNTGNQQIYPNGTNVTAPTKTPNQGKINAAVKKLDDYLKNRENDPRGEYYHSPCISRFFGGFSKTEKRNTVIYFKNVLLTSGDINNLEKTHERVLNQGKLRDVFNEIKKDLKP